jgi:hypothetical protein
VLNVFLNESIKPPRLCGKIRAISTSSLQDQGKMARKPSNTSASKRETVKKLTPEEENIMKRFNMYRGIKVHHIGTPLKDLYFDPLPPDMVEAAPPPKRPAVETTALYQEEADGYRIA